MREGEGARLFRFYQDLIRLRLWSAAFRSPSAEVIYSHNEHRVLAFLRWWGEEEYAVFASLSNVPYDKGYVMVHERLKGKMWSEVLNSDADIYGGREIYNPEIIDSRDGAINLRLPASGLVVLVKNN